MAKNKILNLNYWLEKIKYSIEESFKAVPEELKSAEFCLAAVKNNCLVVEYIPDSKNTETMCLVAVKCFGWMHKYVPESLKTKLSVLPL